MATIKVKFRPSAIAGREGTIYYQIIHSRSVRQIRSDYSLMSGEWACGSMIPARDVNIVRRAVVEFVRRGVATDIGRLKRIISRLDGEGTSYTSDDIVNEYRRFVQDASLTNFMGELIKRMRRNGKIRTSETYTAALRSFRAFLSGRCASRFYSADGSDLLLDCMTAEIMEEYESWLRGRGLVPNTVSFYTRILRAVYNRAVRRGMIDDCQPFRNVYTGIDRTVKRALPLRIIKRIRGLDLSGSDVLCYARDMFIMSFMLRGMSFIDMAFLRKTDLVSGHVIYRRRKTGQLLIIKWTADMQHILDRYPANSSGYLLPIIRRPGMSERCAYRNAGHLINRCLKKIAEMIKLDLPLTLYVARHSWASAARTKNIPVSVISEGLGHESESTTRIYLSSLDTGIVDRANSLILRSI